MKISSLLRLGFVIFTFFPVQVWASESCSPAKKLIQATQAFYGTEFNWIDPELKVGLQGIDGHPDPTQMVFRYEETEHVLPILDGRVENLEMAVNWPKEGDLCSGYADGTPPQSEDPTVSLSVSFEFPYRRKDGMFDAKEIEKGAKEGSKIIKSLAPRGLGFAAPGLKTFAVMPANPESPAPSVTFFSNREEKPVKISILGSTQYVRLKDMKADKIDRLEISGSYKAFAFFKIDPEKIAEKEAQRLKNLEGSEN